MKRFKELREQLIIESEFDPYGMARTSLHTDDGVHRLDNEENLEKINAFVQNFLADSTLYPKARLEQLRVRLNHIGLDFDCNKGVEMEEGTYVYPVEYYGRGYGYHPTTGEIGEFDYGEAKLGTPLQLEVYKEGDGTYNMSGRISFVGQEDDDDLMGEALELLLNIDNDEALFESKIIPALEAADSEEKAIRGLVYAVRSAAKKYEMDVSDDDIYTVAESIFAELMDVEEEVEELDELKKSTLQSYATKSLRRALDGKNSRNPENRKRGVEKAMRRLTGHRAHQLGYDSPETRKAASRVQDSYEPEGESIDELKSSTLRSYHQKAQQDMSNIARDSQSTGPLTGKTLKKFVKRQKGKTAAASRLDARKQLGGAHPKSQRGQEWSGLARVNPKDKD